jgi:raffinose/stachyose/melibiose transport system substrate-binding protein
LIESGFTNADPLAIGYDDLNTQFYAGQFAMHMTGTWMVQGMELNMGDDVGIFVLPPYNDGIRAGAPGGLGAAVIVAAETEHPEEALEFLNLMFKRENADIWFRRSLIPPHVDLEVDEAAKSELFLDAIEIAEYATGFNIDVLMPQNVNEVTMNNMQRLMAGMMTGMEALQSKQQTWEEYLADN